MVNKEISKFINREHWITFIIGSKRSGKSNCINGLVKDLIKNNIIDYTFLISPTAYSKSGGLSFLPKRFVMKDYNDENMKKIFRMQKKRMKENKKSRLLLIFDDTIGMNLNTKTFQRLISNCAHYNIRIIFSVQRAISGLSRLMRANVDYVILFRPNNMQEINNYVEMWMADKEGKEAIEQLKKKEKYTFLFVDTNENPSEGKYCFMKYPLVKKFFLNFNNSTR